MTDSTAKECTKSRNETNIWSTCLIHRITKQNPQIAYTATTATTSFMRFGSRSTKVAKVLMNRGSILIFLALH